MEDDIMIKIKTTKGTWNIFGINLISSDSIYQTIKKSIEEGIVSQEYLQKFTGNIAPIIVDNSEKTIEFLSF